MFQPDELIKTERELVYGGKAATHELQVGYVLCDRHLIMVMKWYYDFFHTYRTTSDDIYYNKNKWVFD